MEKHEVRFVYVGRYWIGSCEGKKPGVVHGYVDEAGRPPELKDNHHEQEAKGELL